MMPVVDKPVIQYVIEEAIAAGITDIVLVTRSGKSSIEDHFDCHYELEAELERKGKEAILASVRDIMPAGVSITAVRQNKALGLGHAVLCAAPIIGDSDFAVLLPDMLINCHGQEKNRPPNHGRVLPEKSAWPDYGRARPNGARRSLRCR